MEDNGDMNQCARSDADRDALQGDHGVIAVFVAVMLALMLMFAAFAIDGGTAYQSHRASQNASDAGVMAGLRVLDQLKYQSGTTAYTTSSIRTEILKVAQPSGADATTTGVVCYLLDITNTRIANSEFCASNTPPGSIAAAWGVEVDAKVTRRTMFAGIIGTPQTTATTSAKAFLYDFSGGTGSPFVMCGTRDYMPASVSDPLGYAYDIMHFDGSNWAAVTGAVGKYYQIQGSTNPDCGAGSQFKGLADSSTDIATVPFSLSLTSGNRYSNSATLTIAGFPACGSNSTDLLNGCGILVPIASQSSGSTVTVVTWAAFQVWGSGSSYSFTGSTGGTDGESCRNPISPGSVGGQKFCGKLLSTADVNGGNTGGPASVGAVHVLDLSA